MPSYTEQPAYQLGAVFYKYNLKMNQPFNLQLKTTAQMKRTGTESTLPFPIPRNLIKLIVEEQPRLGLLLVSTIELTIKESQNHYADVLRSIKPLLKEETEDFLMKIFSFGNTNLEGEAVEILQNSSNCRENSDTLEGTEEGDGRTSPPNNEVVFNKVDEATYTLEEIRGYASKYGVVRYLRRLNRGKYLIIMDDPKSARDLVESSEVILGDSSITKFYNVIPKGEPRRGSFDIHKLVKEQSVLLEKLSDTCDPEIFTPLKTITNRIRGYILSKEDRTENSKHNKRRRTGGADGEVGPSLYYSMLNE